MKIFLLASVSLCLLLSGPLQSDSQAGEPAPETKVAMLAALDFLERCDQTDYNGAWQLTAQLFRNQSEQQDWLQQVSHLRRQYGDFQQRRLQFSKPIEDQQPAGQPMLMLLFRSWFAQKTAAELLTMVKDADQRWRVAGYTIE